MIFIRIAKVLWVLIWIYLIVYNTYFGWNAEPLTHAEHVCDSVFRIGVIVTASLYLAPLVFLYEKLVKFFID